MRDGLIIHDDADKTPPQAPGRHPLAPISGADFGRKPGIRLPPQVWVLITVICILPVLLLLWGVYSAVQSVLLDAPWLSSVLGWLLLLLALVAAVALVGTLAARGYVSVQHARVIRTAHGAPVDVVAAMRVDPLVAEAQQIQLRMAEAPYLQYPNLSTLSQPNTAATKPEAPMLLAAGPALVPDREWLAWIERTPHLMIAGRTNAGKTTLATAILASRTSEQLAILDPHDQPGKWFGSVAIGGGRDYESIFDALEGLLSEMDTRYDAYNAGESRFARLTALIDEVPAIVLRDKKLWAQFASQLGSEARKVNMSMVLLTQSPLVRDIEISSVMRENFTRIALGDQASELLKEETDRTRKQSLLELLKGLEYPAAMEYRGELHLLDTTNVPSLARSARQARLWVPERRCQTARSSIGVEELLIRAVRQGKTREATRATLQQHGLGFKDEQWTEARRFVLRERLDTAETA